MKRYNDYRDVVAAFCFIMLFIAVFVVVGYGLGRSSVKPVEKRIELEQVYHSGPVPLDTPVWAVYDERGALTAYSAIRVTDGTLYPFSVSGQPVPFDPLPEPEAWTALSAGILEALK